MDALAWERPDREAGHQPSADGDAGIAPWSVMEIVHTSFTLRVRRLQQERCGFDLWSCCTEDVPVSVLNDPHRLGLLSLPELQHHQKFKFGKDRDLFLTTRLLVRSVLSRYAEVQPENWRFTQNAFGRPEIEPEIGTKMKTWIGSGRLRFSLSRTGALALCAVSMSGTIGVDVEDGRRRFDVMEMAGGVLAQKELLEIMQLSEQDRAFAVLNYWTLKEAYVKARGCGLTLDVRGITFSGRESSRIEVEFARAVLDAPERWLFKSFVLFERYAAAIAFSPDVCRSPTAS